METTPPNGPLAPPSPRGFRLTVTALVLLALPPVGVVLGAFWFDMLITPGYLIAAACVGALLASVALVIPPLLRGRGRLPPDASPVLGDPDLIRAVLAQHDLCCTGCGYSLRGLADRACPECHEPIRLSVASSPPRGPTPLLVWTAALAFPLIAAPHALQWAPILWMFLGERGFPFGAGRAWLQLAAISASVLLIPVGLILHLIVMVRWWRARTPRDIAAARWRSVRLSAVVLAVFGALQVGWVLTALLTRGWW